MKKNLYQLLLDSADQFLKRKWEPGHNGPYNDPETKVRANAHLTMLYLKCFQITKKSKYKEEAIKCLEYIQSEEARPCGFTFFHRNKKGKDKCNGLIGQAWTIEALMESAKVLKDNKYESLAREVFLLHWFSPVLGYWKRRDTSGKEIGFDKTFNHQLWFAAIGSLVSNDPKDDVGKQVKRFMDLLESNISIHSNGKIRHLLWAPLLTPLYLLKDRKVSRYYLAEKEAGYHAFNLYALALLYQSFPNHSFWKSYKFLKIANYAISEEHLKVSEENKYGFAYNPSGIEQAFFTHVFKDYYENSSSLIKERVERQLKNHLDKKTGLMKKKTVDSNTLSLRIYEAVRLPNIKLDL
jgi:hypothetical protein